MDKTLYTAIDYKTYIILYGKENTVIEKIIFMPSAKKYRVIKDGVETEISVRMIEFTFLNMIKEICDLVKDKDKKMEDFDFKLMKFVMKMLDIYEVDNLIDENKNPAIKMYQLFNKENGKLNYDVLMESYLNLMKWSYPIINKYVMCDKVFYDSVKNSKDSNENIESVLKSLKSITYFDISGVMPRLFINMIDGVFEVSTKNPREIIGYYAGTTSSSTIGPYTEVDEENDDKILRTKYDLILFSGINNFFINTTSSVGDFEINARLFLEECIKKFDNKEFYEIDITKTPLKYVLSQSEYDNMISLEKKFISANLGNVGFTQDIISIISDKNTVLYYSYENSVILPTKFKEEDEEDEVGLIEQNVISNKNNEITDKEFKTLLDQNTNLKNIFNNTEKSSNQIIKSNEKLMKLNPELQNYLNIKNSISEISKSINTTFIKNDVETTPENEWTKKTPTKFVEKIMQNKINIKEDIKIEKPLISSNIMNFCNFKEDDE